MQAQEVRHTTHDADHYQQSSLKKHSTRVAGASWAVVKTGLIVSTLMAFLVAPSGDWTWPAAWFLLAVVVFLLLLPCGVIVCAFNPDLIREREGFINNPGTAAFEQVILPIMGVVTIARFVAAGLQHRWAMQQPGWSPTPFLTTPAQQLAAAGVVLACLLQTWCIFCNKYFSSVVRIQSDRGHKVCSEGPYAWVRHPGYMGFGLHGITEALLLQSSWALVFGVAKALALVVRTAYEDAFLQRSLPGYAAYARQVRYRLVPGLW